MSHSELIKQGLKWERYGSDIIPLWVADMDFPVSSYIKEHIENHVYNKSLGYSYIPDKLKEIMSEWSFSHYSWKIECSWQFFFPGAISAINFIINSLCEKGDEVLTLTPAYPPFLRVGENTNCSLVTIPMLEPLDNESRWTIDRDRFKKAITKKTRFFIFCNPHNPTGRVFDIVELKWLADICKENNIIIISDELHCDLILSDDVKHIPISSISEDMMNRTITLWSASKTFNMAGLTTTVSIIPNDRIRKIIHDKCNDFLPENNVLGLSAMEAAFSKANHWRMKIIDILKENLKIVEGYVSKWDDVKMTSPQGTYLVWLDFRSYDLGNNLHDYFLKEAKVAISDGALFLHPGFIRINFATSTLILHEALSRIEKSIRKKDKY